MYLNLEKNEEPGNGSEQEKQNRVMFLDDYSKLTARELEVITMLADGNTNQMIANRLFVSLSAIETCRSRIVNKLGVNNIAHAIAYAFRNNLIQ